MDIEDLNKVQLILLALLLSFVTSIATGITTVTLMQQAPASFTEPINRVVQQTVEKIVSVEGKTTLQTIVIKEEDLVVDAISKNQSAIFAITKEVQNLEDKTIEVSAGSGFVVSAAGVVAVDAVLVPGDGKYYVKNESGKFIANFIYTDPAGFSFLKIGMPLDEKNKISYTLPTAGDVNKMKAGQKILILGDAISSFIFDGNKDMKLNVTQSNAGGLVLNLGGEVLGIALLNGQKNFTPMDVIIKALEALKVQ